MRRKCVIIIIALLVDTVLSEILVHTITTRTKPAECDAMYTGNTVFYLEKIKKCRIFIKIPQDKYMELSLRPTEMMDCDNNDVILTGTKVGSDVKINFCKKKQQTIFEEGVLEVNTENLPENVVTSILFHNKTYDCGSHIRGRLYNVDLILNINKDYCQLLADSLVAIRILEDSNIDNENCSMEYQFVKGETKYQIYPFGGRYCLGTGGENKGCRIAGLTIYNSTGQTLRFRLRPINCIGNYLVDEKFRLK